MNAALILLAAGRSERFGAADKLMVSWHGAPLAAQTALRISEGWNGKRIAVTSSARVADLLSQLGWTCIDNPAPERGQSSSLKLGLEAADGAEVIVIALADMPGISATHIEAVRDAALSRGAAMSRTPHGTLLPPAGFAAEYRNGLLALSGDQGAKSVFLEAKGMAVDLPDAAAFDIDAPGDLS